MLIPALDFDAALIERYDRSGPRYTPYPTAAQFRANFGEAQYREFAARSNLSARPLSLYLYLRARPAHRPTEQAIFKHSKEKCRGRKGAKNAEE